VAVRALADLAGSHPDDAALAFVCGQLLERERAHLVASRSRFLEQLPRLLSR
jgi:hypothetical protein